MNHAQGNALEAEPPSVNSHSSVPHVVPAQELRLYGLPAIMLSGPQLLLLLHQGEVLRKMRG